MRTINIDEETYRFLQSKAIPYEEQPDDTIKRLLGIDRKVADNQSSRLESNNSKEETAAPVAAVGVIAPVQEKQRELKDFYSKILEKSNSNKPDEHSANALNSSNSNKLLEKDSNSGAPLEQYSNSNNPRVFNSNKSLELKSNSKDSASMADYSNVAASQLFTQRQAIKSNISNQPPVKNKKKPKTSLPELVRAGLLRENERVIFQNYRGIKYPQYEVIISDGQLKWKQNRYSMSDLANTILKDLDPSHDNEFVRGPVLWVNVAGKTIAELWDTYLASKGI